MCVPKSMPSQKGLWSSYALAGALATGIAAAAVVTCKKTMVGSSSTVVPCKKNVVQQGSTATQTHDSYNKEQTVVAPEVDWHAKYVSAENHVTWLKETRDETRKETSELFDVDEDLTEILMEVLMVDVDDAFYQKVERIQCDTSSSICEKHRLAQHLRLSKIIEFLRRKENADKDLLERLSKIENTLKPPPYMINDDLHANWEALRARLHSWEPMTQEHSEETKR